MRSCFCTIGGFAPLPLILLFGLGAVSLFSCKPSTPPGKPQTASSEPTETPAVAGKTAGATPETREPPAAERAAAPESATSKAPGSRAGLVTIEQAVLPCSGAASGRAVFCVSAGNGPAKGGRDALGSAGRPYRRIQAAVAAAKRGDVVQVAAGTYKENLRVRDKQIALLGGFSPDFTQRVPARHLTAIVGRGRDAVVSLIGAGKTVVDGFRITGGTGSELQKQYYYLGGGIYITGGAPTISHNLVEENDIIGSHRNPENVGGGIFAEDASPEILYNDVRKNRAGRGAIGVWAKGGATIEGNRVAENLAVGDHGGGIYASGPGLKIIGNTVVGNRVPHRDGSWGGGILVYGKGTKALLMRNRVSGNLATEIGSGVFVDDAAQATLRNELIFANHCPSRGGAGLYVDGEAGAGSRAEVINTTIAGHRCGAGRGHGIFVEQRSRVVVKNSIIWDNGGDDFFADAGSKTVSYSISQEAIGGKGNLVEAPLFADGRKDFHLQSVAGRWEAGRWVRDSAHSAAIDRGDPKDRYGEEGQPHGKRVNLGAYGGTAQASRSR